ncbi:MAG: hypothetical protein KAT29_13785 [Anaerolineales bacterium]|nr:hypothetical protein [Anaerolineales bacterium]
MKNISVDLNGIDELFQEPEFDPFDPNSRCESGMADLYNQTQDFSAKEALQITISLPENKAEQEQRDEVKNAIQRYCQVKIVQSEREAQEIRKQGLRDLRWAMIISVALLLSAFLITQLTFLPEILIYLLSTGAGIIAWVTLWPPLDSILYEWSPYRQTKIRYQLLKLAQLTLKIQDSKPNQS